jgi:hypothetical protein
MTRPARCCAPLLSPKGRSRCVVFTDLRYNRANETAAEGYDEHGSGFQEASMKRGQLVSRRLRQSQRPCPCFLQRIESP